MKKLKLKKAIASALVIASVIALNPIGVSAEWKQDSTGWWYSTDTSWVTGWSQIGGKWYYFNSDGYMAHDTKIDGYTLGSDGAWIPDVASSATTSNTSTGSTTTGNVATGTTNNTTATNASNTSISDTSNTATATDKDTVAPQLPDAHLSGKNSSQDRTKFKISWTKATDDKTPQSKLKYYLYKSENVSYENDINAWEKNATLVNQGGSVDIDSLEFTVNNSVANYLKLIVVDESNNKIAYVTLKRNIFS